MSIYRYLAAALVLSIGGAVAGCSIYTSDRVAVGEETSPGMIYYLPKTLVNVTVMPFGKKGATPDKHQVKYVELSFADKTKPVLPVEHVPDLGRQYVLSYNPSPLSTDHVCAGAQNGLLVGVQASAADETGNILVSIAKLAGRLAAPQGYAVTGEETFSDVELTELAFTLSIDPLDPTDRATVGATIKRRFPRLEPYELQVDDDDFLRGKGIPAPCPADGVCYRTAVTTRIKLVSSRHASVAYANVINRSVTGHIDISRAFMVEKVTLLTFDKGVLKDAKIKKPSEALAVAKLPLTILDAIMTSLLAAPGNFLANSSGFDAQQRAALVEKAYNNAKNIELLQVELEKVREGDDTVLGRTNWGTDSTFKVTCNHSG